MINEFFSDWPWFCTLILYTFIGIWRSLAGFRHGPKSRRSMGHLADDTVQSTCRSQNWQELENYEHITSRKFVILYFWHQLLFQNFLIQAFSFYCKKKTNFSTINPAAILCSPRCKSKVTVNNRELLWIYWRRGCRIKGGGGVADVERVVCDLNY